MLCLLFSLFWIPLRPFPNQKAVLLLAHFFEFWITRVSRPDLLFLPNSLTLIRHSYTVFEQVAWELNARITAWLSQNIALWLFFSRLNSKRFPNALEKLSNLDLGHLIPKGVSRKERQRTRFCGIALIWLQDLRSSEISYSRVLYQVLRI